jgi:excisionase family DNA binding protein
VAEPPAGIGRTNASDKEARVGVCWEIIFCLCTENAKGLTSAAARNGRINDTSALEATPMAQNSICEYPLTVKEAAKYLGVSPQTVYLWVERKQIPHLRVMGRNIRFLKSDLEPFRASFKQEMENE